MIDSEKEIFDVAIVGLGPAGATLARMLAPRFRIIALDQKKDVPAAPGFRKPCGGLLAEDAQLALARQGLALPNSVLADPQLFTVRTIDFFQKLERNYRQFYINMDRHKFDLWLKSLIPPAADVRHNVHVQKIGERENGLRTVTFFATGTLKTISARIVVGADGAASLVRKTLFPAHKIRSYTAVQEWFEDAEPAPLYACFFDERLTDCYGWAVSKDKQIVFGAALPRENASQAYTNLLKRARDYGFQLGAPIRREACQVLRPERLRDFKLGAAGAFLIGEAAGFISPSSLEGMSYALDSAEMLAGAFDANLDPEKIFANYTARSRKLRLKLLSKILKNPFMYNPKLRKIVMKSGIASHNLTKPSS